MNETNAPNDASEAAAAYARECSKLREANDALVEALDNLLHVNRRNAGEYHRCRGAARAALALAKGES